jgi:hypothetical protein
MKPEPQETKNDFGEDRETFELISAKTRFSRPTNQRVNRKWKGSK